MHHLAVRMPTLPPRRLTHRAVQTTGKSRFFSFETNNSLARRVRPIHQLVQATHRRRQTLTIHRAVRNTGKSRF